MKRTQPTAAPLLEAAHTKADPRRFAPEPVPCTALAELDDPRLDEWRADAAAEEQARRREEADSYSAGGWGL